MKKSLMIAFVFLFCCLLSCGVDKSTVFDGNDEAIADKTFHELVEALKQKDASKIVMLFSKGIQEETELSRGARRMIEFVQGDITSVSSASEAGVGADYESEAGKTRKTIQSAFCVSTTESAYYVAIKECVKDEFTDNNIGIMSIYIIESSAWTEDYVYRGDGNWIHGINVVDSF